MNKAEALKILAVLKNAYRGHYRDLTDSDARGIVNFWQMMFDAEPYEVVSASLIAFIANDKKGFPPVPGQLKDYVYGLLHPDELTDQEAWLLVSRAIDGAAYSSTGFDGLPAEIKELVGSNRQLADWGRMEAEQVDTVVASHFQRSYREKLRRKRELAVLPPGVLPMLERGRQALLAEGDCL